MMYDEKDEKLSRTGRTYFRQYTLYFLKYMLEK